MPVILQRILTIVAAVLVAFLLYLVPDMVSNLGEILSFRLKAGLTVVFLLGSVAAEQYKKRGTSSFLLAAGIALALLLFVARTIRLNELGVIG